MARWYNNWGLVISKVLRYLWKGGECFLPRFDEVNLSIYKMERQTRPRFLYRHGEAFRSLANVFFEVRLRAASRAGVDLAPCWRLGDVKPTCVCLLNVVLWGRR